MCDELIKVTWDALFLHIKNNTCANLLALRAFLDPGWVPDFWWAHGDERGFTRHVPRIGGLVWSTVPFFSVLVGSWDPLRVQSPITKGFSAPVHVSALALQGVPHLSVFGT